MVHCFILPEEGAKKCSPKTVKGPEGRDPFPLTIVIRASFNRKAATLWHQDKPTPAKCHWSLCLCVGEGPMLLLYPYVGPGMLISQWTRKKVIFCMLCDVDFAVSEPSKTLPPKSYIPIPHCRNTLLSKTPALKMFLK